MFLKSGNGRKRESENRQPAMEGLEPRVLLSGDVHVVVVAGVLTITGDDLDNGIQIEQGATPGQFAITSVGLPETTIDNGSVIGVTGDILVTMGGGNDVVNLINSVCPKNVAIDGGAGANTITLSGQTVKGGLTITNGAGNDTVNVGGVVLGVASINDGDGDNSATFTASVGAGLTVVNGNAAVNPNVTALNAADIRGVTRITNGNGGSTVIATNALCRPLAARLRPVESRGGGHLLARRHR
jgi:Ca2+-binding RTX toxin-like protein